MTSTPLGVAYGMGLAWGLPSLAFALWIAAATCYRRAMRNRQRRAAAEQRAANVANAHRVASRPVPTPPRPQPPRDVWISRRALDQEMDEFLTDPEHYRRQK